MADDMTYHDDLLNAPQGTSLPIRQALALTTAIRNIRTASMCAALCFVALAAPAHAATDTSETGQDTGDARDPAATDVQQSDSDDHYHNRDSDTPEEIVVSARSLKQLDVLAGVSVVEGADLQRDLAGQLGDVVAKLPGVSASGFAPGASRPILRGFGGERVKVLVDGIGAIDVSNTSADHAVSIDPLTAERIEVLRGPAVMLFGSQAIGGAVNVFDKRIPRRKVDEPVHLDSLLEADSVSDLRAVGASVDFPSGTYFQFHLDGGWRQTDDLTIPGYVLSDGLRQQLLNAADLAEAGGGDPAEIAKLRMTADQQGTLPDSATETWSGSVGASLFAGGSMMGASFGIYDTQYGIPSRPATEVSSDAEEGVSIGLRQYRMDMRGELDLGDGFFDTLRTRIGYSKYSHTEFEGANVGTVFDVQGIETRLELEQASGGAIGGQYYFRDFAAIGDEAYIAPNRTNQYALFTLQEFDTGPIGIELAGRYEHTQVDAPRNGITRKFDAFSGAVGLTYETESGLRFGVNGSRAERAPAAEEMLSDGIHVATQAYEIGNPNLTTEKAWGLEGYVRGTTGNLTLSIAAYQNWFSDYIYLAATGTEVEGLPQFAYLQNSARHSGIEGSVSYVLYDNSDVKVTGEVSGDYVRAQLSDGTPLARIPPLSLSGTLDVEGERFGGHIALEWYDSQNRTAPFETPTASYALTNASLSWKPISGNDTVTLMLQANNIFNVEGRRHTSFTKDFAPIAGRNFKLSLRASF